MLLSKRTVFLIILAACIAFSAAYAVILAARNFAHACCKTEKSECLPCLQIEVVKKFFKTVKLAIVAVFFAANLLFLVNSPEKHAEHKGYRLLPSVLKVRLNT